MPCHPDVLASVKGRLRAGESGESLASMLLGMESPALCQLLPAGPGQAGCRGWHGCFFLLRFVSRRANA